MQRVFYVLNGHLLGGHFALKGGAFVERLFHAIVL